MKRGKRGGSHGAVSVFLAIILVPCIVFTCVFGDLSRVQLSKATAASAADLALYSMISHYDEDLKEFYGLVSSCQSTDDFMKKSEKYFLGMMQAEGLDDVGSTMLKEYFRSLESGDFSDFLRTEISAEDTKVKAASNATLGGNPALIEDGIVEFMKYRGPVRIAQKLIDRFKDMNIQNTAKDVEENNQIVEKKQAYAEKQGDLLKAAFNSYLAIRDYEKHQQEAINTVFHYPSFREYDRLQEILEKARGEYKGVTKFITNYYYPGTENIREVAFGEGSVENVTGTAANIGEAVESEGGTIYCLTNAKLTTLLNVDGKLQTVKDTAQSFVDQCTGKSLPVSPGSGDNPVVYCMKIQEAADASGVDSKMKTAVNELKDAYQDLKDAAECKENPEGSDLPADWKDQINEKLADIEKVFDDYFTKGGSSDYRKRADAYYGVAKGSNSAVQMAKQRTKILSGTQFGDVELGIYCADIAGLLNEYYTRLEEQKKRLDLVIVGGTFTFNGQERTVPSLKELAEKAGEFADSRRDWGEEAANHNTAYAQEEKTLYDKANAVANGAQTNDDEVKSEALAAKITEKSVEELSARLENIRNDIETCLKALDSFTYGNVPVRNINSAQAAIDASRNVIPKNEDLSLAAGESNSESYYNSLMVPLEGDVYKAPERNTAKTGNDPTLENTTPDLYKFFKDQFQGQEEAIDSNIKENDSRNEQYNSQAEEEKTAAETFNEDLVKNKGEDLTSIHGGRAISLGSALFSIVNTINNILDGNGDQIRDQLYVCEYIMDMFTYSTLDNEGRYRLAMHKFGNTDVSYRDYENNYGTDADSAWKEENEHTVWENQSLTNRHFNKQNNHANLGEVEYILYGNAAIQDDLTDAYKDIFTIREILNLVSGFCCFYTPKEPTGATISTIAGTVCSLTMGIVPVPLTKCVLIGALATMESAKDMERLKKGARVDFYKTKAEQWVCSWSGLEAAATKTEKTLSGGESGLYYSDYMYVFLVLGLMTSEQKYTLMLQRVGDLIQANMCRTPGNEGFTLDNCISYFQLDSTIRVKPLLITLPVVVNTVEEATGLTERTDWCTYKIQMIRGYS